MQWTDDSPGLPPGYLRHLHAASTHTSTTLQHPPYRAPGLGHLSTLPRGADETVEHLVFQCPAHDHATSDTWPGDTFTTDPRRLWSYLERIGAVSRPPPTGNEREREREYNTSAMLTSIMMTGRDDYVHRHLRFICLLGQFPPLLHVRLLPKSKLSGLAGQYLHRSDVLPVA